MSVISSIQIPPDLDLWEYLWSEDETVSASALNMFIRCPQQWYYKANEFPTIEVISEAAEFGLSVHGKIADFYKSLSHDSWLTSDNLKERMSAHIMSIEKRPRGKSLKRIAEALVKFEAWRKKRYPSDSQLPKAVELYFKTPPFHGYVDFAAHDFVLDWKTGSGSVTEDYVRQINIYFYACLKLGLEPKKGFLFYVETGMKPMVPINLDKILRETYAFFVLTSSPSFDYPANPTYLCKWCGWRNLCEMEGQYSHEFIISKLIRKKIKRLMEVGLFEREAKATTT